MRLAEIPSLWMLGCGNMGGALLSRWLAEGLPADRVTVITRTTPGPEGTRHLTAPEGVPPRVLVLAIKPQMFAAGSADALRPFIGPETLVISVLAGLRIETLHARLDGRMMRMMPNTPSRIGLGVSALYGDVTPEDRAIADALATAAGRAVWVETEDQFDAVTGLSGSGPAYVFAFIESLAKAGEAAGLSPESAATLAAETVIGSAALAAASDEPPAILRQRVTSPNGTTQAGLEVLRAPLDDLLTRTVAAAANRSRELSAL